MAETGNKTPKKGGLPLPKTGCGWGVLITVVLGVLFVGYAESNAIKGFTSHSNGSNSSAATTMTGALCPDRFTITSLPGGTYLKSITLSNQTCSDRTIKATLIVVADKTYVYHVSEPIDGSVGSLPLPDCILLGGVGHRITVYLGPKGFAQGEVTNNGGQTVKVWYIVSDSEC